MKQRTDTEIQSGVVVSRGLKNYYTSVNFNVVAVEDYWEYDSVTMTTEIPFTKENFDVLGMVVDELLKEPSVLPVRVVGEIADLFGVGKNSTTVIEAARKMLVANIEAYDLSDNVDSFTIRGMTMWLKVDERRQIATQITANEEVGRTEMTRWFNGMDFTFPLTLWKYMLTTLEVYAGDAINVTESHKAEANTLTTYNALAGYDYTQGYPAKPVFDV